MRRSRQAGFTLLELMISVTIIGVMVTLARPGVSSWRANSRQYDLTNRIALLARSAIGRAAESGVAHQVSYDDNGGAYTMRLQRGMTRRCRQTPWGVNPNPDLEVVDSVGQNTGVTDILVNFDLGAGAVNTVDVCYEPSGRMYINLTPAAPVYTRRTAAVTVDITRADGTGAARQVVLPAGGYPRVRL